MFKSPVRTHKGTKVKQALQICFLLVICFWLIYQVKHSRDQKKALDETDDKQTVRTVLPSNDILKLGRKDVNPKLNQPELINGKSNEEEEDDDQEEENKIEVVTEEEVEDKDDENGKDGVDEVEKSDSEVDKEEEEEVENQEKDVEDSGKSLKNENSLKKKDVEDETTNKSSTHESRDQNYMADDASSAVTQTTTGFEILKKTTENDNSGNVTLDFKKSLSKEEVEEENNRLSDIKSNVEAEAEAKALTIDDDDALNSENGGEIHRDGTDMEMLANVLNEDSNEEEGAAE